MPLTRECDCEKIRRLFDAAIDCELSSREECALKAHLDHCEFCREEYQKRKELVQTIHLAPTEVPSALHNAVMSRIHKENKPRLRFVLSRPQMALVGSLCTLVLIVGVLLSPTFILGNGTKDAENAMPDAEGNLVGSPDGSDEIQNNFGQTAEIGGSGENKNEPATESALPNLSNITYSIADTKITVHFEKDGTAKVTDAEGTCHSAVYSVAEKGLIKIRIGKNEAFFTIENEQLVPKGGDLFD